MDHYRQAVLRALDHLERHLRQPISLDALARRAGFSLWHFHRIFAGRTGKSLGTYACFTHRGPVAKIDETINYAFGPWLSRSRFAPTGAPNFDRSDERFGDGGKNRVLEFLVPIRPKARPAATRYGRSISKRSVVRT